MEHRSFFAFVKIIISQSVPAELFKPEFFKERQIFMRKIFLEVFTIT